MTRMFSLAALRTTFTNLRRIIPIGSRPSDAGSPNKIRQTEIGIGPIQLTQPRGPLADRKTREIQLPEVVGALEDLEFQERTARPTQRFDAVGEGSDLRRLIAGVLKRENTASPRPESGSTTRKLSVFSPLTVLSDQETTRFKRYLRRWLGQSTELTVLLPMARHSEDKKTDEARGVKIDARWEDWLNNDLSFQVSPLQRRALPPEMSRTLTEDLRATHILPHSGTDREEPLPEQPSRSHLPVLQVSKNADPTTPHKPHIDQRPTQWDLQALPARRPNGPAQAKTDLLVMDLGEHLIDTINQKLNSPELSSAQDSPIEIHHTRPTLWSKEAEQRLTDYLESNLPSGQRLTIYVPLMITPTPGKPPQEAAQKIEAGWENYQFYLRVSPWEGRV